MPTFAAGIEEITIVSSYQDGDHRETLSVTEGSVRKGCDDEENRERQDRGR